MFSYEFPLFLCIGISAVTCMSFDLCATSKPPVLHPNDPNTKLEFIKYENKLFEDLTYEGAVKRCRACFDATLMANIPRSLMHLVSPTWIAVTRPSNSNQWKWLNGSVISDWRLHASLLYQDRLADDISYGVISGTHNNKTFWMPIPTDQSFYHNDFRNTVLTFHQNNNIIDNFSTIVCERPIRLGCHYWNVTDRHCTHAKNYGCHKYVMKMVNKPDDDNVTCLAPSTRRFVVQCSWNECICNVTEWTEWSDCSALTCMAGTGQRHRTRLQVDPNCPKDHARFVLKSVENCTVHGCEELKDDSKIMKRLNFDI